ncbi:hypothetical protein E4U56_007561 [Claviceps arundinis]|uniref:Uncharacterized protein n=1 Tax=Claviceps arundinis TaxID=1623583 RepID=A0A9P7MUL8_9HYPO|nr:hypothetical protein E4U56_007561 [Claviceps arundinis]
MYRIWIPSPAKVISSRDIVFGEQAIFDGKIEYVSDNLVHAGDATLHDLALRVRRIELPAPTVHPEVEPFFENYYLDESAVRRRDSDQQRHRNASKTTTALPTPPLTPPPPPPPPAALLAGLLSNDQPQLKSNGSLKTVQCAAAFRVGTEAGNIGKYQGGVIDKAKIKRLLATSVKLHRSQLSPPPTFKARLEEHRMGEFLKEAERDYLACHSQMKSWTEVSHTSIIDQTDRPADSGLHMGIHPQVQLKPQLLKCWARLAVRGNQQRHS